MNIDRRDAAFAVGLLIACIGLALMHPALALALVGGVVMAFSLWGVRR